MKRFIWVKFQKELIHAIQAKYLKGDYIEVDVSEDGENGATIIWENRLV